MGEADAILVNDPELSKVIWARCEALQGQDFGTTPVWIKNAVYERDPLAGWLLDGDGTYDNPIRPAGQPIENTDAPTVVEG